MSAPPRLAAFGARLEAVLDAALVRLEDLARAVRAPRRRGRMRVLAADALAGEAAGAGQEDIVITLDPARCFIAATPIRAADPVEARRMAALQWRRHAPAPPDALHWAPLAPEAAGGAWRLAFARRETLEDLETDAARRGLRVWRFEAGEGDVPAQLRTGAQLRRRRQDFLVLAGGALALALAAVQASAALAGRAETRLALAEARLAAAMTPPAAAPQARIAAAEAAGLAPGAAVRRLSALARAAPADWEALELVLSTDGVEAAFERPRASAPPAAAFAALREATGLAAVAAETMQETGERIRFRLRLIAEEGGAP